jgi:hypothetical protein
VNIFAKRLAVGAAIFGPVVLLWLAAVYTVLSPRQVAVGMITCFLALLVIGILVRLVGKRTSRNAQPGGTLDEQGRRRVLRGIWINKMWLILLAVSLPFGTGIGVANRAWLLTVGGVGINLFLMYAAVKQIRQQRKRLV